MSHTTLNEHEHVHVHVGLKEIEAMFTNLPAVTVFSYDNAKTMEDFTFGVFGVFSR